MIGRKRIDRKIESIHGHDSEVADFPPAWQFTIDCPHHGAIKFDFEPFRRDGREKLAGQMRDAVWSLRHDVVGATLYSYVSMGITKFWRFLDDQNDSISCLADIDTSTIKQFLTWMELQIAAKGKNKGRPWTQSSRKGAYDRIKSLLINRQKYAASETNSELRFPKNPFPLTNLVTLSREAYSNGELSRITTAINADLRLLDTKGMDALPPLQVLAIHLLALAVATGRNPQSLLDLKRDSVHAHPLSDREVLVTEKRRGYSTQTTSYPKGDNVENGKAAALTIPKSVGGHFRALSNFTLPLIEEAKPEDRDFILLYRVSRMQRKGQVLRMEVKKFNHAAKTFVSRHKLIDDHGRPLSLYLARLRPTFGTRLYERTRDIRKVQQALGHSDPSITAKHYVSLPSNAERNHVFVGQAMVGWMSSANDHRANRLAADGKIPLEDARELLRGGYNTLIARCRNPFRENESICANYLPCFTCPQMVVFEDDLWRLYSFYHKLLFDRVKMNPNDWLKTYGPVIKIIDTEIAPQFNADIVESAKERARESPHPAWPRGGASYA